MAHRQCSENYIVQMLDECDLSDLEVWPQVFFLIFYIFLKERFKKSTFLNHWIIVSETQKTEFE